jgi:hypothetical protein
MSNFSQELWDEILIQASMNMDDGKCSMYRTITIPMKVRQGKYSKLKDWEKIFFYDGVKDGRWSKNGVHLKNNNPYKLKGKITE